MSEKRIRLNQKTIKDFIGLLKHASMIAPFEPECVRWDMILNYSLLHHVEVMMLEAMSHMPQDLRPPAEVMHRLEQEAMTMIIQDANQISEIESLLDDFDRHEIPAITLKGWVMKDYYPRTDFRSRADTDIFIHSDDEMRIHDIIMGHEYSNLTIGGKKDNVYCKEPFVTLEIHKNLFMYEDEWNKIFNDEYGVLYIWDRVERIGRYNHIYRMDVDMFYVYHLAHMVKHLISGGGGIGVKAFMDLWLYRSVNEDKMNFDRINRDLETLSMTKFADTVWKLARAWFSSDTIAYPDESIRRFGEYIMDCGAYGHSHNFVANNEAMYNTRNPTKIGYLARRAFPSKSSMEKRFPIIKNYPATLPYYWAKRLWRDGFKRKKEVLGEVNSVWSVDYNRVEEIHEMYKQWGIPQVK